MKKWKLLLTVLLQLSFVYASFSQEKWDLKRCVDYALANNISVKQSDIQARLAAVDLQQSKWSQLPNADFSSGLGLRWGRSIDPNTNTYGSGTSQLLYQTFDLNASVTVFNWHRIRNAINTSRYTSDAASMDVEKLKNDIALNVATYYLQILLARQQVDIAKIQMHQTADQVAIARKKVDAGAIPELEALNLEGQYATDSSNYISAQATADQNLLQLKAVLNIDAGLPFDIATPPVEQIPVEPIAELQPETVYQIGLQNQPAQKANALRIQGHESNLKAIKASFLPTISLGGSLGTQFSSSNTKITGYKFNGYVPSIGLDNNGNLIPATVADANGTLYPVKGASYSYTQGKKSFGERWDGWGTQLDNNFRQGLGLNISVPINSGGNTKFNYERAKLNYRNAQITRDLANQTLKNDIYKAYYSAMAAMQKFNATKTTVALTQKTYDYAVKRFSLGLLSTVDLIISQNNLTRARLDQAGSQFDYVFKMKVLEYYKGMGIRL